MPQVSVIIPHAGGKKMLRKCLDALFETQDAVYEVVIVENGSTDLPAGTMNEAPVRVQVLHYAHRIGFAAACNRGVEVSSGEFVFLLNNDALVEPRTLSELVAELQAHPEVGACQPKILSAVEVGRFDYSSACGGEMDRLGFPYARGRVLNHLETDVGQYDTRREVFWGAGTALMVRKALWNQAGGLEERFYAHMEEIDLLWRIHLLDYRVTAVPQARVHHYGAATIRGGSFAKMFLNHRNNLAMLVRNYGGGSLAVYLPLRMVFEAGILTASVLSCNIKRLVAIAAAHLWCWTHLTYLISGRRKAQALRRVPERQMLRLMAPFSVIWAYYIQGRKTWAKIHPG